MLPINSVFLGPHIIFLASFTNEIYQSLINLMINRLKFLHFADKNK